MSAVHGPGAGGGGGGYNGPSVGATKASAAENVKLQIDRQNELHGAEKAGDQMGAISAEKKGAGDNAEDRLRQDGVTLTDPTANPEAAQVAADSPDTAEMSQSQGTQEQEGTQSNYGQGGGSGSAEDTNAQFLSLGRMVNRAQTGQAGQASGANRAKEQATEDKKAGDAAADKTDAQQTADAKKKGAELFAEAQKANAGEARTEETSHAGHSHHSGGVAKAKANAAEESAEEVSEERTEQMFQDGSIAAELEDAGIRSQGELDKEKEAERAKRTGSADELEEQAAAAHGRVVTPNAEGGHTGNSDSLMVDATSSAQAHEPTADYSATLETLKHAHPGSAEDVRQGMPSEINNAATAMLEGQNPGIGKGKVPKGLTQLHPMPDAMKLELTPIPGIAPVTSAIPGDEAGVIAHTVARNEVMQLQEPVGAEV